MHENILFITADQFRYDALGFQKRFPVRTPNLDRLAAQGVVFDQAYSPAPLCGPARASIMTGCYSNGHGVYYNDMAWPREMPTLPGELAANGYHTTCVGKRGFVPFGRHGGFHTIIPGNGRAACRAALGDEHVAPAERDPEVPDWQYGYRPTNLPPEYYGPTYLTTTAIDEIELITQRRRCAPGEHEPFFMWVSYSEPHTPCDPPEPYFSMYHPDDLPPCSRTPEEIERFPQRLKRFHKNWKDLPQGVVDRLRAQYLGAVTLLDEQIGRLLASLERLGLDRNTLIVFSSDHGDYLGDHYLQQKGSFHDPSARVPMIFHGPGIPQGKTFTQQASLVDLFPTLLDYARLWQKDIRDEKDEQIYKPLVPVQGRSLMPLVRGEANDLDRRIVISETATYGQGIMLRHGRHKANYYPGEDELELFDMQADPHELNNHLHEVTRADLPAGFNEVLDDVLARAGRHAQKKYYYEKVRPVFT